jgi:hypothetical protein
MLSIKRVVGVASRGIPAHPRRSAGAQPQPEELLPGGGAGGVLSRTHGAGYRGQPRQDAPGMLHVYTTFA